MQQETVDVSVDEESDISDAAYFYKRHSLLIRITHWINVLALTLLLMSGLQIFNAHPTLYWGKSSYSGEPVILDMRADSRNGRDVGVTRVFGFELETTGLFGLSREDGALTERGFPAWITLPSGQWLAMGRRWHLAFAWVLVINGLCYLCYAFGSWHVVRDLLPTRRDWRSIRQSFIDHLHFRHPKGEEARRYNILQKLSYLLVIFILLPLIVFTGWAMSPRLNAIDPGWVDFFGGRQSARTVHFFAAWTLVLFVLIHVFEVIVSGFWNNMRSMISGRYEVKPEIKHG